VSERLHLAVTADLHWGHSDAGDEATARLRDFLARDPPAVLVLGGDVGTGHHFRECLALFADLPSRKALVPGNHDLWVLPDDERGDSLRVYREHLPAECAAEGFHYLDGGPLVVRDDLALVGSVNWYDYSWSLDRLRQHVPDWEERLRTKRFTRGRHNDGRFVRWPLDDVRFAAEVVAALRRHLAEALARAGSAVVVTHHPPLYGLSFPGQRPDTADALLWDAFTGNRAAEEVLAGHADRVPLVFCGHTHRARENTFGPTRGYNVGGDYHFKRLLLVDWPGGAVTAHTFGDERRPGIR
jgi:3',5'-cyclic AMP phosphodiesterase CpdA